MPPRIPQPRQNSLPSMSSIVRHALLLVGHLQLEPGGAYRLEPVPLGVQPGEAFLTHESGAGAYVEVHPVLDDLALGDALENNRGPTPVGSTHAAQGESSRRGSSGSTSST